MDNNGKKNRRLFNNDTEKRLMELWHEMKVSTQGEMMTNSEKFKAVAEKLNVYCAANGWPSVTSDQVRNKIDALVAKKKITRTSKHGPPLDKLSTTSGTLRWVFGFVLFLFSFFGFICSDDDHENMQSTTHFNLN